MFLALGSTIDRSFLRTLKATRLILVRGDGHYGRAQVMARCEENGIDYIFGLTGKTGLRPLVDESADNVRTRGARAQTYAARLCRDPLQGELLKARESRLRPHRGNCDGLDDRVVVTILDSGSAEHLYDVIKCARGQAENLNKIHKSQLASDRTNCRSPIANQVRLALHTAAYWLMLTPAPSGAHIRSSRQSRVRHVAAQAPQARRPRHPLSRASAWPSPPPVPRPALLRALAINLQHAGP
ncbi:transposase [Mesorhizobium sp. M0618]|uniref:transposase n=1 Tax=unclassified Mesorhizobium TaxID=325217 RepID=UPI003336CCEF